MVYKENLEKWLQSPVIDESSKEEVRNITNEDELIDRFSSDLEFGTAGLRGIVGAGNNRMNIYTVGRTSLALARVIKKSTEIDAKKEIVIAHDVRNKSDLFTEVAARVFASEGIKTYIFDDIRPTPMLSYAVRYLNTISGIVVTASHNPKDYNGYKVYWKEGSQILDDIAGKILGEIKNIDFEDINMMDYDLALEQGLIEVLNHDLDESYYKETLKKTLNEDIDKDIKIVYTPLNGTGNKPVRHILSERGFNNVFVVLEQENPDPTFKTVGYPNPEDPKAFKYAIELAKKEDADLIIATDPDCDRVAMMGKDKDKDDYYVFNGNQIGAMLAYYILNSLNDKNELASNGVIVKSVVTGKLAMTIAESFNIKCFETLTGFKNICSLANKWDKTKEYKFIYGYEESIGYVFGDHVRDKDGVVSSMIISEMAAYYKKRNMTLVDMLNEIYEKYGYYKEHLQSIVLEGLDGKEVILKMMKSFREESFDGFGGIKLKEKEDFINGLKSLEAQNLLIFRLVDGSWFALRPSGTEPKIKLYIYVVDKEEKEADKKLLNIKEDVIGKLNSLK